ncbi:hypothetical protein mRhiFer1_008518 [Rhinolophus ferrumequinum]|uniref:Uncharacterized protein n=1 Tax=Rhinolophus ferrumequinum TaxID=59479 RepID=A0A7J7UX40_RHIFE|nr:hypothetical protein mRhiFer1_008518 [Rhinolophus ferrumequinum]
MQRPGCVVPGRAGGRSAGERPEGAGARTGPGRGSGAAPAPCRALGCAPFSLPCSLSLTRSFSSGPRFCRTHQFRRTAATPARNCRSRLDASPRRSGTAPSSRLARDWRAVPFPGFAAEHCRRDAPWLCCPRKAAMRACASFPREGQGIFKQQHVGCWRATG